MVPQNEQRLTSLLNQRDKEITSLQQLVSQVQQQQQFSRPDVEVAVKQAVARREEELRILVMKREEVAVAIAKRKKEIIEAVRNREAEVDAACIQREKLVKKRSTNRSNGSSRGRTS